MALDFGFQQSNSPLLAALANAPVQRQQLQIQLETQRRDRLNNLLNTMSNAASLARTIQQMQTEKIAQDQAKSEMAGQKQTFSLLGQENQPLSGPQQAIPGPTLPGQEQPLLPRQTFGQTPQYASQLRSAVVQGFPAASGAALAKQQFGDPEDELMKTLRLKMLGININDKSTPTFQSKPITYDGKQVSANFDPKSGQYYLPGSATPLTGEITPGSFMSPMAEVRRASLVNSINQSAPKLLNPSNFSPSSVAGRAASVVTNADSYLGQVENVLSGKTIADKNIMTTLGIDAARTLTQTGVVSEKTINDLIPQTAKGKFKDWQAWLSNEPVGKDQTAFLKNLATEVRRQKDIKQAILDRTIGGNLPALNELKKLSPSDWEQQITANGLDLDAAKKGHYKLRPEILSSFYGSTGIPGVTSPGASGGTATHRWNPQTGQVEVIQ